MRVLARRPRVGVRVLFCESRPQLVSREMKAPTKREKKSNLEEGNKFIFYFPLNKHISKYDFKVIKKHTGFFGKHEFEFPTIFFFLLLLLLLLLDVFPFFLLENIKFGSFCRKKSSDPWSATSRSRQHWKPFGGCGRRRRKGPGFACSFCLGFVCVREVYEISLIYLELYQTNL